jgi:plastocyanin
MTKFRTATIALGATLLLTGVGIGINARAGAGAPRAAQAGATSTDKGDIAGKVNFRGKPPQLHPILMTNDPVCANDPGGAAIPEDGRVNPNGTLPNAFVYVSKGSGNLSTPAPASMVTMTQKGCRYDPHVLGIQVGQRLQVTSEDPTTHNIHVTPKASRAWNVSQQPGSEPVTTKFSQPEIMLPVRCNVHTWMKAYIGVVTNPYFAVSGNDGSFSIKGVPPGDYTLSIWTATFGTQEFPVSVRAGQTTTADFTFDAK